MRWLRKTLYQSSKARQVLIILDCSYSGNIVPTTFTDPDINITIDLDRLVQETLLDDSVKSTTNCSRAILTSTGFNASAFESNGHGTMTGLLLSALRGEILEALDISGNLSLESLFAYLREQMPLEQPPGLAGEFSAPYILACYPELSHNLSTQFQRNEESELLSQMVTLKNQMSEMMRLIGNSRLLDQNANIQPSSISTERVISLFYSYAHEDKLLRDELEKHLRALKRQGLITEWHDRDISAGTEWQSEIENYLDSANIILLLISPDFLASDYCYSKEMQQALEGHKKGEVRVIPIVLRYVEWEDEPFSKLQMLPEDGKPVISSY